MEQGYYSSPRRKKKRGLPKNIKNKTYETSISKMWNFKQCLTDIKFNLEEHKLVVEPRTLKLKSRFPWEEEENV